MYRFLLLVVNVKRGASLRRDLNDKIIEGSTCIFAGDFKDEIPARAREESQPFVASQNFVLGSSHIHPVISFYC
jgi:hypothetical protein